jgi:SsrA-binding protein
MDARDAALRAMAKKNSEKVIAVNKKAFHDYFIEERYEAGIVLTGTEVKSIRAGTVSLKDSYGILEAGELFLVNCHVSPYKFGNIANHDPLRKRKLLLHKNQIVKLGVKVTERGFTLVPLRIYLKKGKIKIEMGLVKGKKLYDKREAARQKAIKKDMELTRKEYGY